MQLSFSEDRLINAIKTAFACFLGLLVSKYTSSGPGHQWILITIIVVMSAQTHLGGALQKSYMRIVGTLTGAIIALISILVFSHDLLIIKGIIILSCLGYAYLAGKSANAGAACTLGAVTVTMILLNDPLNLYTAFERTIEITIGVIIALIVTRYIFPIHATLSLKKTLVDSFSRLKELFSTSVEIEGIESELLKGFLKERKLLEEAKIEHYKQIKKSTLYHIMMHERHLYRALLLMHYTTQHDPSAMSLLQTLPEYQTYREQTLSYFDMLIRALQSKKENHTENLPVLELNSLTQAIEKIFPTQSFEHETSLGALLTALRFLTDELNQLREKIGQLVV